MSDWKKFSLAIAVVAVCACPMWAQAQNSASKMQFALAAVADGWLVSPEEAREFKGEAAYYEPPALRPRAVVPLIDISQADAPIDPATFKVMYGAFKIDITSRITKFVKVTKDGFNLENAQIPPGKHRLTMQVMDEKQRVIFCNDPGRRTPIASECRIVQGTRGSSMGPMTTRRLRARLASEVFGTSRCISPWPTASRRLAGMPSPLSNVRTCSARASDRRRL